MVTNLTEEAKAIWAKAIAAKDPEEKLRLLQLFFSKMPHHKGTEKLEVTIKREMAGLRKEIEEQKRKKAVRKDPWIVKKEKFPLLVLVEKQVTGLFEHLTGVPLHGYRFFDAPFVGPFKAGGLSLQLYYAPVGVGNEENFTKLIKQADALLINRMHVRSIEDFLSSEGIDLIESVDQLVDIQRMPGGGIRVIGSSSNVNEQELRDLLKGYGLLNCVVKLGPKSALDDVEARIFGRMQKIFVATDGDRERTLLSALSALRVIRVFTLDPELRVDGEPLLLKEGSTVREASEHIRSTCREALLIRGNRRIRVGCGFRLEDGDMVRLV